MTEATASTYGWFPVVTLFFGWALSQVSEWRKDKRTDLREKEARDTARRDVLLEQRNAFQRQTLLDLQDAVMRLMQASTSMYIYNTKKSRHQGEQELESPTKVKTALQLNNAKTALLGVRVRDDEVRSLLQILKDQLTQEAWASDREEAKDAMEAAGQVFVVLNNRIGLVLRAIEDIELK